MKKTQLVAITTLTLTALAAATAICLIRKNRRNKRRAIVSDAGYETAYDIHFPPRYSPGKTAL